MAATAAPAAEVKTAAPKNGFVIDATSTNAMGQPMLSELTIESVANCVGAERDIGQFASWSVSSSKPGFEVQQLTDPSTATFWQCVVAIPGRVVVLKLRADPKARSRIT